MTRGTKRLSALLLALLMCVTLLPAAALAEESGTKDVTASGECGDHLTWSFDAETGVLTITGTGDMWDWTEEGAPWYAYRESITTVELPEGLTGIGAYAFSGCTALPFVIIPEGVTSVGDGVFADCSSLRSAHFPAGVTRIGNNAFKHCGDMQAVTLPENLTSIGDYAFMNCASLTEVTLPEGLESIGKQAFINCSFLESISFPASVTDIGMYAFAMCRSLTEIRFRGSAPEIGSNAFRSVEATAYYPSGDESWTENVRQQYGGTLTWEAYEVIGFSNQCGDDLSWSFDEETGVLTITGTGDMWDWTDGAPAPWYAYRESITTVELPEGLTGIGAYAFSGCTALPFVIIPEGVTSVGDGVFADCSSLRSAHFPAGVTRIGNNAFKNCGDMQAVTLPESLTSIGDYAFMNCASLTEVTLPEGLESIGKQAFISCGYLESISFPASVTDIGMAAFAMCRSMTEIRFKGSAPEIGSYAFRSVEATAYYPSGDESWTEDVRQQYGGRITWFCLVTVSFNAQGGAVDPESMEVEAGTAVGELPTPVREEKWAFMGWYTTTAESYLLVTQGTRVDETATFTGDTILYARWRLRGDVDGDGKVSGADLVRLAEYIKARGVDVQVVPGSVNIDGSEDGRVNGLDLIRLAEYIKARGIGVVIN